MNQLEKSDGFSVFELLIVIVVASAAVAIAVPQIQSSLAGERLVSSADQLAAEINMARTLAVSRNTTYELQLNSAMGTYQIIDPEDPENPPRAEKSLGSNLQLTGAGTIQFFARGHCSGGQIQLSSSSGGGSCTLTIARSGHVQVGGIEAYGN